MFRSLICKARIGDVKLASFAGTVPSNIPERPHLPANASALPELRRTFRTQLFTVSTTAINSSSSDTKSLMKEKYGRFSFPNPPSLATPKINYRD